jgi:hypothetical protein
MMANRSTSPPCPARWSHSTSTNSNHDQQYGVNINISVYISEYKSYQCISSILQSRQLICMNTYPSMPQDPLRSERIRAPIQSTAPVPVALSPVSVFGTLLISRLSDAMAPVEMAGLSVLLEQHRHWQPHLGQRNRPRPVWISNSQTGDQPPARPSPGPLPPRNHGAGCPVRMPTISQYINHI